jgi:hypothetical protein
MRTTILSLCCLAALSTATAQEAKDKKVPEVLEFRVAPTAENPTVAQVNKGDYAVNLTMKNVSDKELVLWPYLEAKVLDEAGKDVRRSRFIGRWGLRKGNSILEDIPFVRLKAGESHTFKVTVGAFPYDAKAITGWTLSAAGEYTLELRYRYDRAEAKKTFGKGCKVLDDPRQPWNQAPEIDRKFEVKIKAAA